MRVNSWRVADVLRAGIINSRARRIHRTGNILGARANSSPCLQRRCCCRAMKLTFSWKCSAPRAERRRTVREAKIWHSWKSSFMTAGLYRLATRRFGLCAHQHQSHHRNQQVRDCRGDNYDNASQENHSALLDAFSTHRPQRCAFVLLCSMPTEYTSSYLVCKCALYVPLNGHHSARSKRALTLSTIALGSRRKRAPIKARAARHPLPPPLKNARALLLGGRYTFSVVPTRRRSGSRRGRAGDPALQAGESGRAPRAHALLARRTQVDLLRLQAGVQCSTRLRLRIPHTHPPPPHCLSVGSQECPTGIVSNEKFRDIFSQFFPQGGIRLICLQHLLSQCLMPTTLQLNQRLRTMRTTCFARSTRSRQECLLLRYQLWAHSINFPYC